MGTMFVTDAHTTDDLMYVWDGPGGGFENATLELAEFEFMGHSLDQCSETFATGIL